MRVALAALSRRRPPAQDRISALTAATDFGGGAVHTEIRLRAPIRERIALEPMASWTQGFSYGNGILVPPCDPAVFCESPAAFRTDGTRAVALGSALSYRVAEALPFGLDGAHVGVFAQAVFPIWSGNGQRLGAEAGAEARIGRLVTVGADVQAACFTDVDGGRERVSVAPLVRLAVGR